MRYSLLTEAHCVRQFCNFDKWRLCSKTFENRFRVFMIHRITFDDEKFVNIYYTYVRAKLLHISYIFRSFTDVENETQTLKRKHG